MPKHKKNNVISLREKLETWKTPFTQDNVSIAVSSNGRMKIEVGERIAYLDTVDAVGLMSKVSAAYEKEFNVLFEDD